MSSVPSQAANIPVPTPSSRSDSTLLVFIRLCVCAADLGLSAEVTEMLNECEQPGLVQTLLLPEDLALRHLPALNVAHRRLDFSRRNLSLSTLQEVRTLRHARCTSEIFQMLSRLKTMETLKRNDFIVQINSLFSWVTFSRLTAAYSHRNEHLLLLSGQNHFYLYTI